MVAVGAGDLCRDGRLSGLRVLCSKRAHSALPSQHEAQLNRLVRGVASTTAPGRCTSPYSRVKVPVLGNVTVLCSGTYAEFDANGYNFVFAPGLAIATAGQDFGEECLLQLDGPWWEQGPGGGGISCPYGFTFIPGG